MTIILLLFFSHGLSAPTRSDIGLNTVEIIKNHGYSCETHHITTEDGYILTYHRIPTGTVNNEPIQTPVLLMHGIMASSESFLYMGPKLSLGFILADLGYDVWLANARGNPWSRDHLTLNPLTDSRKFFDFSWHEIGYYDLPAAIDYILNITDTISLYYIGFSQGGTAFLVLCSSRPEYNTKIKLASLTCPVSFMEHQTNPLINSLSEMVYEAEDLFNALGVYELPLTTEIQTVLSFYCQMPNSYSNCMQILYLLGMNSDIVGRKNIPVMLSNTPARTALKQFFHFGQLIKNGGFQQYDHGPEKNIKTYGSIIPPSYDLSKISTPVAVYCSLKDPVVNYLDVKTLLKRLPNVIYEYVVTENIGHLEFNFYKNICDPTDGELIKTLKKF